MKKGITLTLEVYLEGEQDPAADFLALTTMTVRTQLQASFSNQPQGLTLQIKKLQEQDNSDDDDNVVLPPALPLSALPSKAGSTSAPNAAPATSPGPIAAPKGRSTAPRTDGTESQLPKLGTKYKPPSSNDGS